jgi:tetratricopeptide (TPR) repeat protein
MSKEWTAGCLAGEAGELSLVLAEYLAAVDRGEEPDRVALLDRHPHLADRLRAFFAEQDGFDRLTDRLRSADTSAGLLTNFELVEEIDRGGMGIVLRGRDRILDRDLAIKVLPEHHRDRPDLVRRFVAEARITGQLQHPYIVPVHELGYLPDGRPFFAMKLVQGRTLAELLRERTNPAADRTRFLSIFEQICQTIAYAHSKGVIHRDLKPANVMVGAFGEVQVMDWGLAKLLDETPADGEEWPAPYRDEETKADEPGEVPDRTQSGAVLGTFAFMPPEQAAGERGRVGRPSDVFGLGAILCEILTGQSPYTGDAAAVRDKARTGRTAEALERLEDCGADAELIELARRCLATDPTARPADGAAVAAAMSDYLAAVQARLRAAELARTRAETEAVEERKRVALAEAKALAEQRRARAERRRRRVTLLLGASLVLLVGGASGVGLWLQRQQAAQASEAASRRAATERDVTAALAEFSLLRAEGLKQTTDTGRWALTLQSAESAVKRAENALDLGESTDALRDQVAAARAALEQDARDCRLFTALERLRLEAINVVDTDIPTRRILPGVAAAFRDYGLDLETLSPTEAGARIRESRQCDRLRDEVEFWAQVQAAVAGSKPSDDVQLNFKGPTVGTPNWSKPARLVRVLDAIDPDPACFRRRWRDARTHNDASRLIELAGSPEVRGLSPLSLCCLSADLTYARAFDAARKLLLSGHERSPGDVWLNLHLGILMLVAGSPSPNEAVRYFTAALAVRGPDAPIYILLSRALALRGDVPATLQAARAAVEVDPHSAPAETNLGLLLFEMRDLDGALPHLRKAAELDPGCALPHHNLGIFYLEQKQYDAALPHLRAAVKCDPSFASARVNLGNALVGKHDLDGAIAEYRAALAHFPTYALAHNNLGQALVLKNDLDGAERSFRAAIDGDPNFLGAYYGLGELLARRRDLDGAIKAFQGAIDQNPNSAEAHCQMGRLLTALGRLDDAEASLRKAIDLDPKLVVAHVNLAVVREGKRDLDGAIACYRSALKLNDRDPTIHLGLGVALFYKDDLKGAIRCQRRAVELDPTRAMFHHSLATALQAAGDMEGAAAAFRRAVQIDPKFGVAQLRLARALLAQGDADGGEQAARAAVAQMPQEVEAYTTLAAALVENGAYDAAMAELRRAQTHLVLFDPRQAALQTLVEAVERFQKGEQKLPAVLRGEAEPADVHDRVALALICARKLQRPATAGRLFADAFAHGTALGEDATVKFRYLAACSAVLAGTGQADKDGPLDDAECRYWRHQALDWLRANLTASSKQLESGDRRSRAEVLVMMQRCLKEADLAAVRDPAKRAKLPAAERVAWERLWNDFAALLKKASEE